MMKFMKCHILDFSGMKTSLLATIYSRIHLEAFFLARS